MADNSPPDTPAPSTAAANSSLNHDLDHLIVPTGTGCSVTCNSHECTRTTDLKQLVLTAPVRTLWELQEALTDEIAPIEGTDSSGSGVVRDALAEQAGTSKDLLILCLSKIPTEDLVGVVKHRASVDDNDARAKEVARLLGSMRGDSGTGGSMAGDSGRQGLPSFSDTSQDTDRRLTLLAAPSAMSNRETVASGRLAASGPSFNAGLGSARGHSLASAALNATGLPEARSVAHNTAAMANLKKDESSEDDSDLETATFKAHLVIGHPRNGVNYNRRTSASEINDYKDQNTGTTGKDMLFGLKEEFRNEESDYDRHPCVPGESQADRMVDLFAPFAMTFIEGQHQMGYPIKFHFEAVILHDFFSWMNGKYGGLTSAQAKQMQGVMKCLQRNESRHQMEGPLNLNLVCNTK